MSCIEIPGIEKGFIIRDKESKIKEAALVVNSIHRLKSLNDKEGKLITNKSEDNPNMEKNAIKWMDHLGREARRHDTVVDIF